MTLHFPYVLFAEDNETSVFKFECGNFQWCIEILGQLSSKFNNTLMEKNGLTHSASLNELLQMWLDCYCTKSLIEIATNCISSMYVYAYLTLALSFVRFLSTVSLLNLRTPDKVYVFLFFKFRFRIDDSINPCIDALLETSVRHSPHFDWVVAHIG